MILNDDIVFDTLDEGLEYCEERILENMATKIWKPQPAFNESVSSDDDEEDDQSAQSEVEEAGKGLHRHLSYYNIARQLREYGEGRRLIRECCCDLKAIFSR